MITFIIVFVLLALIAPDLTADVLYYILLAGFWCVIFGLLYAVVYFN